MRAWVLELREVEKKHLALVGGKGLNLGELSRIEGVRVPDGFCVTTEAYRLAIGRNETVRALLDELAGLKAEDRERIGRVSARVREAILAAEIPAEVASAVADHLSRHGEEQAYAVRSSATAEDLPHASFAGQQDSYLNIVGLAAILRHVRLCWASLFTDRAVVYRMRNGFDHRLVHIAVVVQRMVRPQASGVMFTADPVTMNRKVVSIDAVYGLGEALVSGRVAADGYRVRDGEIVERRIAAKTAAVHGRPEGGTETKAVDPGLRSAQVLTDEQILRLADIGRRIEACFGQPRDIEWCLAQDAFHIVQSRPITTLFPIPDAGDRENRVYVSVGHQQMMTDPIRPLGLSFYLMTTRAPMRTAGGRLFVDVTAMLASPEGRERLLASMEQHDPLMKDALMTVIKRGFIPSQPGGNSGQGGSGPQSAASPARIEADPAIVADLIRRSEASIEACRQAIRTKSGPGLFDFIQADIRELQETLFHPQCLGIITAVMNATAWINEKMREWLGERNAADTLAQSVPGNVTSEMGLELLEVADAIRPHPEIVEYLRRADEDGYPENLERFEEGKEARKAIEAFLAKYGMRCVGEIDITRTRWSEKPAMLIPMILSQIRNHGPNEGRRKFEQGLSEARNRERELLERLRALPDGERKAAETRRMIDIIRNCGGFREYPKYAMVNRYFIYKQALMREAGRLAQDGVIGEPEDIFWLTFDELREAVRTQRADRRIIDERKHAYRLYETLIPPRVITSEGESITGRYGRDDLPAGAIPGLAVSSGVAEGRARVVLKFEDADLEEGDILVTRFTDPSWTPAFLSVKALVAEVGGLMTHGAVIAREYGLPAVVGVVDATRRIKDGDRIRVNGTEGYVEML
jgi:pyruvate,water dikinase